MAVVEVAVGISAQICTQSASADCPEKVGQRQQPSQQPIRPDETHVHVLYCGNARERTSHEGVVVCPNLLHISANGRRGGRGGIAAGGCRLQGVATGKQNMAAALSLAIKHTEQKTELHKLANSSQIA